MPVNNRNNLTVGELISGLERHLGSKDSVFNANRNFINSLGKKIQITRADLRYILARINFELHQPQNDDIRNLIYYLSLKSADTLVSSIYTAPNKSLEAILATLKYLKSNSLITTAQQLNLTEQEVRDELDSYKLIWNPSRLIEISNLTLLTKQYTIEKIIKENYIQKNDASSIIEATTKRKSSSHASSKKELKKFKAPKMDNIQCNMPAHQYSISSSSTNINYPNLPPIPNVTLTDEDLLNYQYQNHLAIQNTLSEGVQDYRLNISNATHLDTFSNLAPSPAAIEATNESSLENPYLNSLSVIDCDIPPDYNEYTNEEVQILSEIYAPIQETNIHNTTSDTSHTYDTETYNQLNDLSNTPYGPVAFTPQVQPSIYQHIEIPSQTSYQTQDHFMNEVLSLTELFEHNRCNLSNQQYHQSSVNHELNIATDHHPSIFQPGWELSLDQNMPLAQTIHPAEHHVLNERRIVTTTEESFNGSRYGFFNQESEQTSENHEQHFKIII